MFISAEVIVHPEDENCTHREEVSLVVIGPKEGFSSVEEGYIRAFQVMLEHDERIRRGEFSALTMSSFRRDDSRDEFIRAHSKDLSGIVVLEDSNAILSDGLASVEVDRDHNVLVAQLRDGGDPVTIPFTPA